MWQTDLDSQVVPAGDPDSEWLEVPLLSNDSVWIDDVLFEFWANTGMH
jgi:hypothetical protein